MTATLRPGLLLHARSRGLYPTVAVLSAIAVLSPLGLRALRHLSPATFGGIFANVMVMSVAAGVATVAQGLAGADPELEGTVPRNVPGFRLVHLVLGLVVLEAVLVLGFHLILPGDLGLDRSDQLWIIARDTAGLFGLAALTGAVVGARFSWAPVTVWVLALSFTGLPRHGWREVAAMPKAPADYALSAAVAIVLLVVGVAGYAIRRISR